RTAGRPDARGLCALGPYTARLRRPARAAPAGGAPASDLSADPRSAGTGAGDSPLGVLASRAGRRADGAPDRHVRDAPDGRRARAAEALLLRRGLAAARG